MTVNAINSLIKIYKISIVLFSWCRYRCLWKIPCFLSKVSLFSSCDARTDVCDLFMTSDFEGNNPRTTGIGGNWGEKRHRRFNLQSFFALQTARNISHFVIFKNSFFRWFSTFMGNSSTLERKRHTGGYKGTQRGILWRLLNCVLFFLFSPSKCNSYAGSYTSQNSICASRNHTTNHFFSGAKASSIIKTKNKKDRWFYHEVA